MGTAKAVETVSDAFYGLFMQQERLDRIAKSMMLKGPLSLVALGVVFYLTKSVFWGVVGLTLARIVILAGYDFRNAKFSLKTGTHSNGNLAVKSRTSCISTGWPLPRWNPDILKQLVWLALPLGFVTLLNALRTSVPQYFIEHHLGTYQLGLFAAVASFQRVAPTVVQALGRSASPRLAKHYSTRDIIAFRRLMRKLIGISVTLGCAGVLVALVAGPLILTVLYGPAYVHYWLFVLLMIAAAIDCVASMLQYAMISVRCLKIQVPVLFVSTGTVVIACFLLVPSAGMVGAAIALLIGAVVRTSCSSIVLWHALSTIQKKSQTTETTRLGRRTAEATG